MRFKRVKYTALRVELEWAKERADGAESKSTTLSSTDQPLPAFIDAVQAFRPFVITILELPEEWAETLTVQSVAINEEQDGRLGCVITSLKKLSVAASPFVPNTPHLREDVDLVGGAGFMLPGMVEAIETLEAEAERYVDGERAQGDLFTKNSTESTSDESKATIEMIDSAGRRTGPIPFQAFERGVEAMTGKSRRKA